MFCSHFQICLTGEPKFISQRTFYSRDFVPAKFQVKWPRVVVVPKKRGGAAAVVFDASNNFEIVGRISDDQVKILCFLG
jgi:hypothetical protein